MKLEIKSSRASILSSFCYLVLDVAFILPGVSGLFILFSVF